MTGSYWNHIRWRCSTGGELTKITPSLPTGGGGKSEGKRRGERERRRRETMSGGGKYHIALNFQGSLIS